jgi:hypothetical protein
MRRAAAKPFARIASAAAVLALLGGSRDAGAVFIQTALGSPPFLSMRVGSNNTTVNLVGFTVSNANIMPNPTPVTGVPTNGAPTTSPAGGVEIEVVTRNQNAVFAQRTMTLTVDSSAGLTCVAGTGCGSTIIPFSSISWTSYNLQTGNNAGQDIQSGAFTGSASQQLATYTTVILFGIGSSVTMNNVLVFQYDNATLYPSGRYLGRVTFTATNV